jgi:hypothetical protein
LSIREDKTHLRFWILDFGFRIWEFGMKILPACLARPPRLLGWKAGKSTRHGWQGLQIMIKTTG